MLRILQLEEIERKLLEVSALIDKYKDRSSTFVEKVDTWLYEVDEIFQRNRLTPSGRIAGLRGVLHSVHNGLLPQTINIKGRSTLRKRLEATAIDLINQAVNIVEASIHSDRLRVKEAEKIALQLISVSRAVGLLDIEESGHDNQEFARNLITLMKSTESTYQGVIQLEGLIGQSDSIIMIDRFRSYDFYSGE